MEKMIQERILEQVQVLWVTMFWDLNELFHCVGMKHSAGVEEGWRLTRMLAQVESHYGQEIH